MKASYELETYRASESTKGQTSGEENSKHWKTAAAGRAVGQLTYRSSQGIQAVQPTLWYVFGEIRRSEEHLPVNVLSIRIYSKKKTQNFDAVITTK